MIHFTENNLISFTEKKLRPQWFSFLLFTALLQKYNFLETVLLLSLMSTASKIGIKRHYMQTEIYCGVVYEKSFNFSAKQCHKKKKVWL